MATCEYDSGLFLCLDATTSSTAWRFLDELPSALGVQADRIQLVREMGDMLITLEGVANELRESGMLGHSQQAIAQLDDVRVKRAEILQPFVLPADALPRSVRAAPPPPAPPASSAPRAWNASAVASEMHTRHCCVVDDFLDGAQSAALRELLGEMRATGELQPGEVSGGLKPTSRGDLMKWVSTDPKPKPPLAAVLAAVDELVGALSLEPLLADDLGAGKMLVRHEMQCTCYPGNGARYVRHVDDAQYHKSRRLTCIVYANPGWHKEHGGELRCHVKSGTRDVAPLHGRLILFWSDSRCPHEVLPAYRERYAVSIWFCDAAAVAEAYQAEQAAASAADD